MTVLLYTLSGMRLANGAEAPLGCDLDYPERSPSFEVAIKATPVPASWARPYDGESHDDG